MCASCCGFAGRTVYGYKSATITTIRRIMKMVIMANAHYYCWQAKFERIDVDATLSASLTFSNFNRRIYATLKKSFYIPMAVSRRDNDF